jgi:hypothetical protein
VGFGLGTKFHESEASPEMDTIRTNVEMKESYCGIFLKVIIVLGDEKWAKD